jgi:undecaprenyl diphosphate synthase
MVEEISKLNHIAVILDGNRRFAKSQGKESWKGHEAGADTFENFLKWCKELEIKEITAYVLSTENLKRDKIELDFLFSLFKKFFKKFQNSKEVHENKVRIRFIGDLSLVSKDIQSQAREVEEKTKAYNNYILNFCFAYGGRLELVDAFNKLHKEKSKDETITEQDITNNLWLEESPDLIIRTGDSSRTSNFLPWQSVYSEWIFLEKMWPEFTKEDLINCIKEFQSRKRKFGK